MDIYILLSTITDCLRFVTGFFEVISQSAPHIYHSALQLSPKLSIVQKLYGQHISSPVARVMTGVSALWDSCMASVGAVAGVSCAAWSPCGQSIVADFGGTIQVQDSTTLERTAGFKPPSYISQGGYSPAFLTFSPDGCMVACSYQ